MKLTGGKELKARLRAIKTTFKPVGKEWAEETASLMRPAVPEKTGRLRRSFRVKNASMRKATVAAHYSAFFIDAGTVAHPITPRKGSRLRWQDGGNTIFARKVNHPATRARPFRERTAREALRRKPMAAALIKLWNRAKPA